jgi:hypothetical protein
MKLDLEPTESPRVSYMPSGVNSAMCNRGLVWAEDQTTVKPKLAKESVDAHPSFYQSRLIEGRCDMLCTARFYTLYFSVSQPSCVINKD